ncbi:Pleckstrin homology domain-containing protein, partial [Piptocephalis cylindrospora]
LGSVSLRHSLTVALPPPGYSSSRPHVFALQLPTGGVYLFQAASPDLVAEWVSECNYWAARESKEPLAGGVDNREYGWVGNFHLDTTITNIADWSIPQPSMLRSKTDERGQLRALLKHIATLEADLLAHKELRDNVDKWPARSPAHAKAFANWERKSQFLLRELIKYQTYADILQQAVT